jgi:competence protein ComEA
VHSKDKRTLVLFLFGLLALAPHFLPTAEPEQDFFYGLLPEKAGQSWQIIKAPKVKDSGASSWEEQGELAEWTESLPLDPLQEIPESFPAMLSLFLNQPLPINRANQQSLAMLPGVGPHLAAAIDRELQRRGKFAGPDDLLAVPGIGPHNLQRLLPLVSFQ